MYKYGVESFKIITLLEAPNESLDKYEIEFISNFNTLSPNGYNLTSGGANNFKFSDNTIKILREKSTKWHKENMDAYRREESKGLPQYVSFRLYGKRECYYINNHELCSYKSFLVDTYGSRENAKNAALEFLRNLEETNTIHCKIKKSGNIPIGISKIDGGYLVRKRHKKKTYEKRFILQNKTDEEKLQDAIKYLNNLLELFKTL